MKRILFCWIVAIACSTQVMAQKSAIRLSEFSKTRADFFLKQRAKAAEFSLAGHVPLFFTDEKGNHARIVGVSRNGKPIFRSTLNAEAALTTGTDQLHSGGILGLNLQGEGMLVGVWDGGIVKDHIELGQRVISKQGTTVDTHATHVTGTLIATGFNPAAKGMAPMANATTWYFDNDEAQMAALARPDQASLLVSNHSYGTAAGWFKNNGVWLWTGEPEISDVEDFKFGFYGDRAQVFDQLAALAPYYTIVWAAGNDRADVGDGSRPVDCNQGSGYDCIIPESVAKNILTVGAVNEVSQYTGAFSVGMSFFSSWGPTDDGRIKPDLVGDGVNVFSLSASGTNTYTFLTGTSMSTPNVAGSLLLLQELYSRLHGGVFMKSATVKALAIHTTKEAGNFPGPDYSFGWGLMDAAAAGKLLIDQDEQNIFVRQLSLKNGETYELTLNPKANQKITATIAWTDPAGTPVAESLDPTNLMLVNDLDVRIIDDVGSQQFPWILDPSNPSRQATLGDNFRDNVEKLEFNSPEGKPYKLVVSHKGQLSGGIQEFSLIVSYTSTSTSKTYYWVGGSGDWSDATHWSLSSGGAQASTVPTAADKVIMDENSFDSLSAHAIGLSQNVSCASLLWMSDRQAGVALNSNTLSVGQEFVLGTSAFSVRTPGVIQLLSGSGTGNFWVRQSDLTGAALLFDGSWNMTGNIAADELMQNSGTLNVSNSELTLKQWVSGPSPGKLLQMMNSKIYLSESGTMNGGSQAISSLNSSLHISSAVELQWQSVSFPGEIIIDPVGTLTANGNNHFGKISLRGSLILTGSNTIDTLTASSGASVSLASATVQTLTSQTQLEPMIISSTGMATLNFQGHDKFCFHDLNINNVGVTGNSVVNAGVSSNISNAPGWQQKNCGDVLFANFDVRYPCAGGLTQFIDTSTGNIIQHDWRIGSNPAGTDSTYTFNSPGNYSVTLSVHDVVAIDSVTKIIQVLPNTLTPNQIVVAGDMMTSFEESGKYQWYRNGAAINAGTERSLHNNGDSGLYFVVTYDETCNVISQPLEVTGLSRHDEQIAVYPNPASDVIRIVFPEPMAANIRLLDLMGGVVAEQPTSQAETTLNARIVAAGIYILQINSGTVETRKKIVIYH